MELDTIFDIMDKLENKTESWVNINMPNIERLEYRINRHVSYGPNFMSFNKDKRILHINDMNDARRIALSNYFFDETSFQFKALQRLVSNYKKPVLIERTKEDLLNEPTSNDLEEAAKKYAMKEYPWQHGYESWNSPIKDFKAGAEWQKQQMIKDVVLETKVMMDCDGIETPYEEWLTLENTEIPYIPDNLGLKEGDKVKIIIVKEQQ
jgi:hypothetical protein